MLCIFDELPIALWITTYTSMGECYIILSWPPGQQIKIATIACVCGLKDQASQGLMLFKCIERIFTFKIVKSAQLRPGL